VTHTLQSAVESRPHNPYKPLWVLFALIVVLAAFTAGSKLLKPKDKIPWRTDFAAAESEARQSGKLRLADFTATWCGPCQRMESETWPDSSLEAKVREFVPVKVDIDRNEAVARQYNVEAIPTIVVLDTEGNVLKRTEGYAAADELLAWLAAVTAPATTGTSTTRGGSASE
jgi:thiol:disulfide interchange protein